MKLEPMTIEDVRNRLFEHGASCSCGFCQTATLFVQGFTSRDGEVEALKADRAALETSYYQLLRKVDAFRQVAIRRAKGHPCDVAAKVDAEALRLMEKKP